uniref:Cytochrome P450 n=1 Tax=Oryza glumipatula TaxID=40148 RepID=A0A0E0BUK2_9ORYZ
MAARLYSSSSSSAAAVVGVKPAAYEFVASVIMSMVTGERMAEEDVLRFKAITEAGLAAAGAANRQDFLPFLRLLDFGRARRRLAGIAKERHDFGQRIVDEYRRRHRRRLAVAADDSCSSPPRRTVIGDLLRQQESSPESYADEVIRTVCLVASLVDAVLRDAAAGGGGGGTVTLRPRLFELVLNVMLRAVTARRHGGDDARRFQGIVEETFAASGAPTVGDFFPALRWVDRLRGVVATLQSLQKRRDAFVAGLVDDHRRTRRAAAAAAADKDQKKNGIIDALLTLQETDPDHYTDNVVKGIVLVLLTAGTDTSALTTEWAMAQLVAHPEAMRKVRAEIDANVGAARLVEEADMASLPYLQCVVRETLRLRPVGPVIPAHEAMEDCKVGGYHVRRGTMILVNAWAIHRDGGAWGSPEEFRPERFMDDGAGGVVTAVTAPMLPFGLGRRRCPGEGLTVRLVGLTVAALVQCFDWDVGEAGAVDMAEGGGLTMPMATPLAAVCRPREFAKTVVSDCF